VPVESRDMSFRTRGMIIDRMHCVDQTFARLSESTLTVQLPTPSSFSSSVVFHQNTVEDNVIVQQCYAPLTLEKQFQDLYRLFRPALLVKLSTVTDVGGDGGGIRNSNSNSSRALEDDPQPKTTAIHTNASAFIQGSRGSGKSLLVRQVLQAVVDEIHQHRCRNTITSQTYFRYVYINGLLIPGHSVHTVVREILNQLIASSSPTITTTTGTAITTKEDTANTNTQNDTTNQHRKKRKQRDDTNPNNNNNKHCDHDATSDIDNTNKGDDRDNQNNEINTSEVQTPEWVQHLIQLKQTNFTNQLQLLNEIIALASIDHIPIIFVFDELDTFVTQTSSSSNSASATSRTKNDNDNNNQLFIFHQERQLLLYHLLERVMVPNSCCNFIGITSDSTIMMKLEKRIKSRAEGTSKFIMTPSIQYTTFDNYIVPILCHKIFDAHKPHSSNNKDTVTSITTPQRSSSLMQEVTNILQKVNTTSNDCDNEDETQNDAATQSTRTMMIYETMQRNYSLGKDVRWFCRVFYVALSLYRCDLQMELERQQQQQQQHDIVVASSVLPRFRSKYFEEAIVDMGGSFVKDTNPMIVNTPVSDVRIQTLHGLSGPQVALVLSARRILYRDSCMQHTRNSHATTNTNTETSTVEYSPQLTLRRMIHEYGTSYKGQTSRYTNRILHHNFIELLEMGIFRPSMDHSGAGPFQYQYRDSFIYNHNNVDVMERLPLHMTMDIHFEVKQALESNMLNCSTALREWGRKTN
jgi:Cdc6-like AAA superfamily ATPase